MTLTIDVWSDVACPWCYVGKRRLEAALAERGDVLVRWRAFELDPSAPAVFDDAASYAARLARKYGRALAEAEEMIARMTQLAADDGIEMRFDRVRPGNTFDAHRLLRWALEHGRQDALKERLLRGYFTDGEPIGDRGALAKLAGEIGLPIDEAREVLASDRYAVEVRADQTEAAALGIRGVPFFVFGERFAVSGAQPVEVFRRALATADAEASSAQVCAADGCE